VLQSASMTHIKRAATNIGAGRNLGLPVMETEDDKTPH
jgi:hypothetical protein